LDGTRRDADLQQLEFKLKNGSVAIAAALTPSHGCMPLHMPHAFMRRLRVK
jgi:hypothetical protein